MEKSMTRRGFLAKATSFAALASTIQILPSRLLGKNGTAPSNIINVGFLGVGGIAKGHYDFVASSPNTKIRAICDVRQSSLNKAKKQIENKAKKNTAVAYSNVDCYEDYHEVLNREDIDAIWVCTPDHWHVQMAVAALLKGKAVYVEKPVSLTVEEGRILADVVAKTKGILQVGSQQRSSEQFRLAAQLLRNGYLGKIKRIDIAIGTFPARPTDLKEEAIPEGFNYDKWLGQTPWMPYNQAIVKYNYNGGWRCFLEFGARKEGDWGAHHYDIIQWGLNRDTSGPCEFYPENTNGIKERHFRYDTGETVYVNPSYLDSHNPSQTINIIGEEAEIMVNRTSISSTKPSLLKMPFKSSDEKLQVSTNHREDFLDAFRYGHKNIAPAETGHRTASVCQLMSIARRAGESFKWDPKTETITEGSDTVKSMLSRARRAPYFIGS